MGYEEDHGVLTYVVDDGDVGHADAEQNARQAAEGECDAGKDDARMSLPCVDRHGVVEAVAGVEMRKNRSKI